MASCLLRHYEYRTSANLYLHLTRITVVLSSHSDHDEHNWSDKVMVSFSTSVPCQDSLQIHLRNILGSEENRVLRFWLGNNKGKIVPVLFFLTEHHTMKTYWGNGGIAPRILWSRHWMQVSGQLHALATLPPGERAPGTPRKGGWVGPEPFWTRWWREKFPAPAGNRTLEPGSSNP
jgi:hypothetical protein